MDIDVVNPLRWCGGSGGGGELLLLELFEMDGEDDATDVEVVATELPIPLSGCPLLTEMPGKELCTPGIEPFCC